MSGSKKIECDGNDMVSKQKSIMTSVEVFKSAIVRIRDILRGPGVAITGMDSMRHICLYLLSRYMTRSKVSSLGVPDEFAWENLIETAQTKNGGVQKALDCFYHKEEDSLVNHFDRLFGTEKFSFDIKNPQKHKEILEILNGVKMEDVDCQMDILGWVYEQHLKTGSSAARDLGQFFTDRFICSYMVKLCSPKFKSAGVPESVCDPSMGTGGFLTAFIKYFKEVYPDKPIDWTVQQKEIHGCDTDPKVAGVSRLNLFMETGGNRTINLLTHDSLYGDLIQTGYDVILANMPFGLKGIKHADCCERVKALKIRGTKSEPLFLQLMMASLNMGGRCAVVVPDGMLVNSSSCHNDTRKYLLDHFELKRVIKMKGQFFMNTGIQPSILFFEKTGKPTEAVEFWEVLKGDKGEITETMIVSVPRSKVDDACSLDMRRYRDNVNPVVNPAGFPMVKLGDIVKYENGKTLSSNDKIEDGEYNVMGGGMTYIGKTTKFNRDGETISISKSGASAGFVAYHNIKYWAGDCLTIVPSDNSVCNIKYLYYYLKLNNRLTMSTTTGSTIPHCKWDDIKNIGISLPSLEIQNQIVATLDQIYAPGTTELSDTLKMADRSMDLVLVNPTGTTLEPIVEAQRFIRKSAQMVADVKAQMVADVKAQMVAIMKSVGSRGFEMKKLGDVFEVKGGKAVSKINLTGSKYPYYGCNGINGMLDEYLYDGEYIVCAQDGSIGSVYLVDCKFYPSNHTHILKTKNPSLISNKFGAFFLKLNVDWKSITTSLIPKVTQANLLEIQMPLPPLEFQEQVLSYLNDLQTQLTSLENLQKQSERNAKFILDSYLNTTQ